MEINNTEFEIQGNNELCQSVKKINIKAQLGKIYAIDTFGASMLAGASWVALLAARGFSTLEIGWFESIFHVVSMICEVPSGAVSDVFGRKKSMVLAQIMSMLSAMIMIFADSFVSIAFAMGVSALSYNLASGTREALAYDSMKIAGVEKNYEGFDFFSALMESLEEARDFAQGKPDAKVTVSSRHLPDVSVAEV